MWSPLLGIGSSAAECRILEFLVPELCERMMCKMLQREEAGVCVCVGGSELLLPLLQIHTNIYFNNNDFPISL